MSIELHILVSRIQQSIALNARRTLRSNCLPQVDGLVYFDRIEIVNSEIALVSSGNAVQVRVPADAFVVSHAAVLAAPNGVPAGVNSVHRITLIYELRATVRAPIPPDSTRHPVVELIAQDPDLGPVENLLGPATGTVKSALRAAVQIPALDLTGPFQSIRMPMPRTADVVLVAGVLAVRFDLDGAAPTSRLIGSQQWGLFLSGSAWEELARSNIQPSLGPQLSQIASVETNWRPRGSVPHVDLRLIVRATLEHPFGAEQLSGWVSIGCDFELVPSPPDAMLRLTASWSLHTATPVGGFVEGIAEGLLEDLVADELDPARFGAVSAGERRFILDRTLSPLDFASATFLPDTLIATPAGATLGGLVSVRGLWEPGFDIEAGQLSGPTRIRLCSVLAKAGSGRPGKEPLSINNSFSTAVIGIAGMGRLCEFQVISPTAAAASYLRVVPGADSEHVEIRVSIPYPQALAMNGPLQILVKTPRGVRLIDLGHAPEVQTDENGRIVNGIDLYIPDCLHFHGLHMSGWGLDGKKHLEDIDFEPPPLEDPNWTAFVGAGHGLSVQLVTLNGLEPGELVRFRSRTHAMDVSADTNGIVTLPVLVSLNSVISPAKLERVNRRPLQGHVAVDTAAFQYRASIAHAGTTPRFSLARDGSALLTTLRPDRAVTDAVRPDGTHLRISTPRKAAQVQLTQSGEEVALNPQPLPPEPPPEVLALGLGDLSAVVPIAGSEGSSVVVAVRPDGTKLLLNKTLDGGMRVAGTFRGPVGPLQVTGDWVAASDDGTTSLLSVVRTGL